MTKETPAGTDRRYEFRCWPSQARTIHDHLNAAYKMLGVEERVDAYVIDEDQPDILAKLRDHSIMEVKRRLAVRGKLELWEVAFSRDLPLDREAIDDIADILPAINVARESWRDHEGAISALAPYGQPRLVRKLRRLFERDGCKIEASRVIIDLNPFETVALECRDERALREHIAELELDAYDNVNFGEMLRRQPLAA